MTEKTVLIFENSEDEDLKFRIQPSDRDFVIPPLGRLGLRFSRKSDEQQTDRHHIDWSRHGLSIWCDDQDLEIDIVAPTAFERVSWLVCVAYGWCGSFFDGKMQKAEDYLPKTGVVTAQDYQAAVFKAEGASLDGEPFEGDAKLKSDGSYIIDLFRKEFGSDAVPAEEIHNGSGRPFDVR
ncbi:hypothetical protein [Sphingomicrobium flavum]|uniref:hypothetical protein n=1 Tax=Sphingomicrobium flavum TaxID=1229164 RepID=UPI0021ADF9E8|nr:hypothetical protein [Sphingomicrobium flavum]